VIIPNRKTASKDPIWSAPSVLSRVALTPILRSNVRGQRYGKGREAETRGSLLRSAVIPPFHPPATFLLADGWVCTRLRWGRSVPLSSLSVRLTPHGRASAASWAASNLIPVCTRDDGGFNVRTKLVNMVHGLAVFELRESCWFLCSGQLWNSRCCGGSDYRGSQKPRVSKLSHKRMGPPTHSVWSIGFVSLSHESASRRGKEKRIDHVSFGGSFLTLEDPSEVIQAHLFNLWVTCLVARGIGSFREMLFLEAWRGSCMPTSIFKWLRKPGDHERTGYSVLQQMYTSPYKAMQVNVLARKNSICDQSASVWEMRI